MRDVKRLKAGRRSLCSAAVALILMAVLIILPSVSGSTASVDLSKGVSLEVHPSGGGSTSSFEDSDIDDANVVIDLYKVADAEQVDGYDTYKFTSKDPYKVLFNESEISIDNKDITNDTWRQLGQEAAEIALGTKGGTPQVPEPKGSDMNTQIPTADSGVTLTPGLYLVIARGSDIADDNYIKSLDNDKIVTIARSKKYEYTFEPELVALPTKDDVDGTINTANPGEWKYDSEIYLKAERTERRASLEIVKTLDRYETKDPVTFIFQVEGKLPGTNEVYSNVIPMVFTAAGTQKSDPIENLPVGMEMTVTEIYGGDNYKLTTSSTDPDPLVIAADKIVQAKFENDYDDTFKGGGSIINKFSYDATRGSWYMEGTDDEGKTLTEVKPDSENNN